VYLLTQIYTDTNLTDPVLILSPSYFQKEKMSEKTLQANKKSHIIVAGKGVPDNQTSTRLDRIFALLVSEEFAINEREKGEIRINWGNGNITCDITSKTQAGDK